MQLSISGHNLHFSQVNSMCTTTTATNKKRGRYKKRPQTRQLCSIMKPESKDVLCGKVKTYERHPGNQNFRVTISKWASRYTSAQTKSQKMKITAGLVVYMQTNFNSRFLKKSTTNSGQEIWEEIPDKAARDKVSHALRFAIANNRAVVNQLRDPTRLLAQGMEPSTLQAIEAPTAVSTSTNWAASPSSHSSSPLLGPASNHLFITDRSYERDEMDAGHSTKAPPSTHRNIFPNTAPSELSATSIFQRQQQILAHFQHDAPTPGRSFLVEPSKADELDQKLPGLKTPPEKGIDLAGVFNDPLSSPGNSLLSSARRSHTNDPLGHLYKEPLCFSSCSTANREDHFSSETNRL